MRSLPGNNIPHLQSSFSNIPCNKTRCAHNGLRKKKWTLFCTPKLPANKSILLIQVLVYNWVSLSPSSYLMIVFVWIYHFYSLNFAYQEMRKNNQSSLLSGNAMHLKCSNIQSLFFLLSTESKIKKTRLLYYTTINSLQPTWWFHQELLEVYTLH